MNGTRAGASVESVAAAGLRDTYVITGPIDATRFYPKFGPLPAVASVVDQTGTWDTPGRSRRLELSDGGSVVETITDAISPTYFAYELTQFQKLFGVLVDHARAEWTFGSVNGGTRIRWTYTFFARPGWGWAVRLIVRAFWVPYMARVLPPIAREVERIARARSAAP